MKRTVGIVWLTLLSMGLAAATTVDFTLPRADGTQFRMRDHIGSKVFVIDFWATWCKPCKTLLKRLQDLKKELPEVEVIAISVDDSAAHLAAVNYIKGKGYDFITLFDAEGKVAKLLNPSLKIPYLMIVDRKGETVFTHAGYLPGLEVEIKSRIEKCR